jgi:hypothetical protein
MGTFEFVASVSDAGRPTVRVRHDDRWMGDPLTDNSHVDDGYRFHDVIKDVTAPYEVGSGPRQTGSRPSSPASPRGALRDNNGGTIILDSARRSLTFVEC